MLASSALFFGYVRLGVAYLPVMWILQAMAMAWLLRVFRHPKPFNGGPWLPPPPLAWS